MQLDFDLQLFGGLGGKDNTSTQTTTYTPTEYELALQGMAKNWAEATQPNALWLNDTARQSLESSLANLGKLDYGSALGQSIGTIGGAQNGIYSNLGNLNYGTLKIDNALADIASRYTPIANRYSGQLEGLADSNSRALSKTNSTLDDISGQYKYATTHTNDELEGYKEQYTAIANAVNKKIGSLIPKINKGMETTNEKLAGIEGKLDTTFDDTNAIRDMLIQGYLPDQYLTNMENAIRSTLNRTMGSSLNTMANRGVINSSVNTRAQDDISRNAADSVAKEYQSNISLIDSLLGTKASNALSLLGQQANLANQEYTNLLNAMDRNFNIYQTQGQNSFYALGQRAGLAQQQLGNIYTSLGAQTNIANQQLSNTLNTNNANASYYGQAYNAKTNALNQQANIQNQRYSNLGNTINTSNSGLASAINSASSGLNAMNTANAGALSRGSNLWSMANALGGNTTSALAAAHGTGTQTTSTTQPSGGDFFSNLLAGAQIAGQMGAFA